MDDGQYQKISEHIGKNINEEVVALASLLTKKSKEIKELFKETRNNSDLHQLMIKSHIISVLLEECSTDEALGILKNVREGLIKTGKMFSEVKE